MCHFSHFVYDSLYSDAQTAATATLCNRLRVPFTLLPLLFQFLDLNLKSFIDTMIIFLLFVVTIIIILIMLLLMV